jgi:hypothetical protein
LVTGIREGGRLVGLVGHVYHYGPKRWWVPGPLALLLPPQRIVLVFETRMIPLREGYTDDEYELAAAAVALVAEERAALLNDRARSVGP